MEVISSSNGGLQTAAVQLLLVYSEPDSSHCLKSVSSSKGGRGGVLRGLSNSFTGPFSKILGSDNPTFCNLGPGSSSIFL